MNEEISEEDIRRAVRAAASLIGRLGASKGGIARAKSLDAFRRFEIATHAANVRWARARARRAAV